MAASRLEPNGLFAQWLPLPTQNDEDTRSLVQPAVSDALNEVGISSPGALLATWVTGREGLEHYAAGALPVTDDQPRIEYASWVRRNEIVRVLPKLLALRTEPPLVGNDSASSADIAAARTSLMAFYAAGINAYQGDREGWSRSISEALRTDHENPYYRWALSQP